jgi:hypothetical protein
VCKTSGGESLRRSDEKREASWVERTKAGGGVRPGMWRCCLGVHFSGPVELLTVMYFQHLTHFHHFYTLNPSLEL